MEISKVCELCGKRFLAHKTSTRYCSHQCSQRAYKLRERECKIASATNNSASEIIFPQKKSLTNKLNSDDLAILNSKEFLSVLETAQLLGLCRATVNNYCVKGKLKCLMINRKIFIRRKDIDGLFEYAPIYQVKPKPTPPMDNKKKRVEIVEKPALLQRKPISEFYTVDEIAEKYNYSKSAVYKMAIEKQIPKIVYQGKTIFSKEHIDKTLSGRAVDPEIMEWYSVEEIKSLYSMSTTAVYSFVSKESIPRKNDNGKTYYSKLHTDALLVHRLPDQTIKEWYSMEEIIEKFGFTAGYTANFVFKNGIPKRRSGNKGFYSKEHFDRAIEEKKPANEYIYMEDALMLYSTNRNTLYALVRSNNIPKIKDGKRVKILKPALDRLFNPPLIY